MNYHNDKWIMEKVQEHYQEALEYFPEERIVGIFLQGSQNYGLDTANSDIDTKLIVTPSLSELATIAAPISTTHIRENNEHIDFKDVRNYLTVIRKQNLNFLEILYTPYKIINPLYQEEWKKLEIHRDEISSLNRYRAIHSMKGLAWNKYMAMETPYPSKVNIIKKYGYDGKQVHHLRRIDDYIARYIEGKIPYAELLYPSTSVYQELQDWKEQKFTLEEARTLAKQYMENIVKNVEEYDKIIKNVDNPDMIKLLEEVQYNILKISLQNEIKN